MVDTPVAVRGLGENWVPGQPVYYDPAVEKGIITHSMMKTFRMCPQQFNYKYIRALKPKVLGRPLRFGTWMHELYEAFHKGEDWKVVHERNTKKFSSYFDEEKIVLGNLPRDCYRTMISYIWHYKEDEWKVLETEFVLEAELPDGTLYRGKIDMLIENQYGLWIVDHKNHKRLPDLAFRMLDAQSALYIWAAMKNGLEVQGHIWNYVRSTPPSEPEMLKSGKSLSRSKQIVTDYPHLMRAIKRFGLEAAAYDQQISYLKRQQYQPGELQTSPFFRRDVLEKTPALLKRVATEGYMTHNRIQNYHWDRQDRIERNPSNSCKYMCSYTDLCTTELFGGNTNHILRHGFSTVDPMDYYNDEQAGAEGGISGR